jgi:hypothetical protein
VDVTNQLRTLTGGEIEDIGSLASCPGVLPQSAGEQVVVLVVQARSVICKPGVLVVTAIEQAIALVVEAVVTVMSE